MECDNTLNLLPVFLSLQRFHFFCTSLFEITTAVCKTMEMGFDSQQSKEMFRSLQFRDSLWAQLSLLLTEYQRKRGWSVKLNSTLSTAEIKNEWIFNWKASTYGFMTLC
jgi:hypothetical protein